MSVFVKQKEKYSKRKKRQENRCNKCKTLQQINFKKKNMKEIIVYHK